MKFTFTTPSATFQHSDMNTDLSKGTVPLNPNYLNCQHINILSYLCREMLLTIILVFPLES